MPAITKKEAWKIARKLRARIETGRKHDIAVFEYEGKIICQFGIRRGKDSLGHDFVASQIFVSRKQALDIARCPIRYDDWLDIMRDKDLLPS